MQTQGLITKQKGNQECKILVIIPARSGSKGLPHKNIKICDGISLLERAVRIAKLIPRKTRIVVSSDSEKYIESIKNLIEGPYFLRPDYLSGDRISDAEVMIHALHTSETIFDEKYRYIILLQPTSPLRNISDVMRCVSELEEGNADSCMTVQPVNTKYHPLKSITTDEIGVGKCYLKDGDSIITRQQLKETYIRNGGAYAMKPDSLCKYKTFFTKRLKLIKTEDMISIDTQKDFEECEKILKER